MHDNCKCMVDYTNSRGVRSQRLGRSRFVEVNYTPTRLTDGAKRGAGEPKRLTGAILGDIIDNNEDLGLSRFNYDRMTEEQRAEVIERGIREDKPVFSHDTANNHAMEYCQRIRQDDRFYYIFSHGSVGRIDFFHEDYPQNDPRGHLDPFTLAEIVRGRDDFKQYLAKCSERGIDPAIRLLCCHTSEISKSSNCFGQLFFEEIGYDVYAPDDIIRVDPNGGWKIGYMGDGKLTHFGTSEKV